MYDTPMPTCTGPTLAETNFSHGEGQAPEEQHRAHGAVREGHQAEGKVAAVQGRGELRRPDGQVAHEGRELEDHRGVPARRDDQEEDERQGLDATSHGESSYNL